MVTDLKTPMLSVVICAFNGERWLRACLRSLQRAQGMFEIIVVDNGSADDGAGMVEREFAEARVIRTGENLGFAGGNNVGIQAARGEVIVLLNQDTEVEPESLERIAAAFAADARIGAVGCKLLYPDRKTIQHAGAVIFPNGNTMHVGVGEEDRGQYDEPRESEYVTGAALGLRRVALEEVGLLDAGYFPAYFEELDLLMRMRRAGWKVWYEPRAVVVHHESQTMGAGSARFVRAYTLNRLRYLALNGTPYGWRGAVGFEVRWLGRMMRSGGAGFWAVMRAYGGAMWRWRGWRREREQGKLGW
jgi:GT2 family glycosyltransferase